MRNLSISRGSATGMPSPMGPNNEGRRPVWRKPPGSRFPILWMLLLWVASGVAPVLGDAVDFAALTPEETLIYAQAENLGQLREAWLKTPYYQLWVEPKFEPFFKPLKTIIAGKRQDAEKKQGVTLGDLKQIFPSQIAVFLSELRFSKNETTQEIMAENNTGLIGRFAGDKERIRRLVEDQVFKDLPAGAKRSTETFQGTTIYVTQFKQKASSDEAKGATPSSPAGQPQENQLAVPENAADTGTAEYYYEYAFVDDVFIILEGPRAFMKKVLANYSASKAGSVPTGALVGSSNYSEGFGALENKPDARVYVNVQRLIRQMEQNPEAKILERTKPLHLEEIHSVSLALRLAPKATELDYIMRTIPSPQGLARLILNGSENTFLSKALAPRDSIVYSCVSLDLSDTYKLIRDFIGYINKDEGKAFDQIVGQMAQGTGVSIPDLLAQAGSEIAMISFPVRQSDTGIGKNQKSAQVGLVRLKNEEGFAANLAKLLPGLIAGPAGPQNGASQMETADFKGTTVYTVKGKPTPGSQPGANPGGELQPRMSFAVAKSFFIVGSQPDAVRRVLQQTHGEGAEDITANPGFRDAVVQIKPGYSGLTWYDLKTVVEEAIRSVQAQPFMLLALGQFVQTTQMPTPEGFGRYFGKMVGASYTSKDTAHGRLMVQYP